MGEPTAACNKTVRKIADRVQLPYGSATKEVILGFHDPVSPFAVRLTRVTMEVAENKSDKPQKLGMPDRMVYINGNTRKGYLAVVESGILTQIITNERLARRGYYDISEACKTVHLI